VVAAVKLRAALAELCALEMGIQVDFEDEELPSFQILRNNQGQGNAWPFWPPGGNTTLEVPCSFHTFRLRSKKDILNGQRLLEYEVGIQVAISGSWSDAHLQSERALGVHEAFMDALSARLMLGDGQTYTSNLRSENGATLARLVWPPESDVGYVGLDYTIDLYLHEAQLAGPG
jgi:hypothetical protein